MGSTHYASGQWIGVELDEPLGRNNGVVKGVKYFDCQPGHGIIVRPQELEVM